MEIDIAVVIADAMLKTAKRVCEEYGIEGEERLRCLERLCELVAVEIDGIMNGREP